MIFYELKKRTRIENSGSLFLKYFNKLIKSA